MESWELLSWNVKWVHVSVICELKTESSYALIWILEKQATNGNHDCTDMVAKISRAERQFLRIYGVKPTSKRP